MNQKEYQKQYKRKPRTKEQHKVRMEGQRKRYWKSVFKHGFGKGAGLHFVMQLEFQNNCCDICGKPIGRSAHLDHDHKKKKSDSTSWRGALCPNCNRGIGFFKENISSLMNAISYLEFWKIF